MQIVFIVGYMGHLQQIGYGPSKFTNRNLDQIRLGNVPRTAILAQCVTLLPRLTGVGINKKRETHSALTQANPRVWLPFIEIRNLEGWRDYLAEVGGKFNANF